MAKISYIPTPLLDKGYYIYEGTPEVLYFTTKKYALQWLFSRFRPVVGHTYYVPTLDEYGYNIVVWSNTDRNEFYLKNNLLYLCREDAQEASKQLLESYNGLLRTVY